MIDCISDPRDPRYTVHGQRELLAQRIFSLALGYEDFNEHQTLRDDPVVQVATGKVVQEDRLISRAAVNNARRFECT